MPLPGSELSELPRSHRWGLPQTATAACLLLGALAALAVDLPLAGWLGQDPSPLPKALVHVVTWAEAFAHGLGVPIFALAVILLDPAHRPQVPRLLTAGWGSGLMADLAKLAIQRFRPREFNYVGGVFDTFGPLINVGKGTGLQSFPSAHSAVAVGMAVGFSWLYPRGRWLFAALAALACMQRLASDSHFLSDVLAGATIGFLFGQACVGSSWLGCSFDRWEASWRRRSTATTPKAGRPK